MARTLLLLALLLPSTLSAQAVDTIRILVPRAVPDTVHRVDTIRLVDYITIVDTVRVVDTVVVVDTVRAPSPDPEPAPDPEPDPEPTPSPEPTPDPEGIRTLASLRWERVGSSVDAWTDGDPSRNYWCNSSTIDPRVVAAADVGWPGPGNVFTTRNTTAGCGGLLLDRVFPRLPQAGDTWVWRYHYRQDAQSFSHQHGLGDLNPVGSIDLTFHRTYSFGGGAWNHLISAPPADFGWNMLDNTAGQRGSYSGGWSRWRRLQPDTWYRFTFVMQWASSTQYRLYVRVHDLAGNLIATEDHYVADYVGGQGTPRKLTDFYDQGGYLQRRSTGDSTRESIRNWYLGVAQSKSASSGRHYYAAADVGVCTSLVERCFYGAP